MKEQHGKKKAFVPVIGNVVLILFDLVIALGSMEILMSAFPNWVPAELRVNLPARRVAETINEYIQERLPDTASQTPGN
jgi:hypothetical protein